MEYVTREGLVKFLKSICGSNTEVVSDLYNEIYDVINAGYSNSGVSDEEFEYIADMIMEGYGESDEY